MNITRSMSVQHLQATDVHAYLFSAIFIVGNILLPQLCHLVQGGGLVWLPIYFFTLIAAYRYGITTGLVTAVCSPIVNNLLFAMPPTAMLPVILTKSVLLAVAASAIAKKTGKATLLALLATVVAYQTIGSIAEWGITGSLTAALQDIRIGWRGMLVQVIGGWIILNSRWMPSRKS